jgi:Ca2+/Na+ antiporter
MLDQAGNNEHDRRDERRSRYELVGESMREIGILLLVFVPLDVLLHQGRLNWVQAVICIALVLFGSWALWKGIRLEGRPK